jgi:DNA-binding IclR family transcriptional regulator
MEQNHNNEETWREELAQLAKGLSHPHRVRIIEILVDLPAEDRCMVNSIVDQLPISQSTVSQHLKTLKESGWIWGKIDGSRTCYCLTEGVFDRYRKLIDKLNKNED